MSASKYDIDIDLGAEGTSHRHMVELVGSNKRVLDVGCASGYLAKTLAAFGNTVTGVEYDPEAAEESRAHTVRTVVADLDHDRLADAVPGETFDVIIFGDVLEHLRDPLPPLRDARRMLSPGGYVVISIPNISHGDVRLSLLLGRFPYRNLGLLDNTHLRFFTRETLRELLADAGFVAAEVRTTRAPLFGTELGVTRTEVDEAVLAVVESDPDSTVYQFVVTGVPEGSTTMAASAAWSAAEALDELGRTRAELTAAREALEVERTRADELEARVQREASEGGEELSTRRRRAEDAERELTSVRATRTFQARSTALRILGRR
jgi:2-polyprenyl-3-methyl-5-hydroxy-6-metoxy-1,4-benzoquinol methylase